MMAAGSADAPGHIVETLAQLLLERYVHLETAESIVRHLRNKEMEGHFARCVDTVHLCETITEVLQEVSRDLHLKVTFSERAMLSDWREAETYDPELVEKARRQNYGFARVEWLKGNIGYLDFRRFYPAEIAAETALAAFGFVSNSDALILDLRNNTGGWPSLVPVLCSYFFAPEPAIHLNTIQWREGTTERIQQFWTLPFLPGSRYVDKPVFLLTSRRTFSAAEEFVYNLKNLARATVIGEGTAGGAHPGRAFRVADHVQAFIPTGQSINPITHDNWEGTGVQPDTSVPADEALTVAYEMALRAEK